LTLFRTEQNPIPRDAAIVRHARELLADLHIQAEA
jgi:hypothetical protein